jgi:hypothetical protein
MSTKIYNGFRLAHSDLLRAHDEIMAWRRELDALHRQKVVDYLARTCIGILDRYACDPSSAAEHHGNSPLSSAYETLFERQKRIRTEQSRDPEVDFGFQMALMPFEGRVYGIVYTEQRDWLEAWMAKPFVEPFPYWNNTDRPDTVREDEWNERARIWHEITERAVGRVPAMAGFTVDCTLDAHALCRHEDVLARIPSFENRLARISFNIAVNERVRAELEKRPDEEARRSFVAIFMRASDWVKGEEGAASLQAVRERCRALLKREITMDDLLAELPKPLEEAFTDPS